MKLYCITAYAPGSQTRLVVPLSTYEHGLLEQLFGRIEKARDAYSPGVRMHEVHSTVYQGVTT